MRTSQSHSTYQGRYQAYNDSYLYRWTQPDTIILDPNNPQALNRYAYVLGNPIRYNDPTGHDVSCPGGEADYCSDHNGSPIGNRYELFIGLLQYALTSVTTAPGVSWEIVGEMEDDFSNPVYGYNPVTPEEDLDPEGLYIDNRWTILNDDNVYISTETLGYCHYDLNCASAVAAHEAAHSWIEYHVERTGSSMALSLEVVLQEEAFVDFVILSSGQLRGSGNDMIFGHYVENLLALQSYYDGRGSDVLLEALIVDVTTYTPNIYGVDFTVQSIGNNVFP